MAEQWAGYRRIIEDPARGQSNLWTVTDARDAAQAFRLAVENDNVGHEVFLINGADTSSLVETPALIARYYADVPVKTPLAGHTTLVSHEKATRMLGYQPQYTWRESDFQRWMEASS